MLLVVPICLNFRFQLAREHPFPCLGSAGETAFGFRDCARGVVDIKLFFFALPKIKKEPTTIEKPFNPELLQCRGPHWMIDEANCHLPTCC